MSFFFLLLFITAGLLLAGVSVPLIRRQVRPNPWYGFRTPKTLGDERVWYEANAYSGRMLLRAGVADVVAAVLFFLVPGVRSDPGLYPLLCVAVCLVGVVIAVFFSFRYLQTL